MSRLLNVKIFDILKNFSKIIGQQLNCQWKERKRHKLTERGLCKNKLIKSLSSKVRPITNIIKPRAKLYEVGPALTNHEKVDGLKQATTPPIVT